MNETKVPVIAIDGSSASGKGTIAEGVAKSLKFNYLDSGAIYRVAAYAALKKAISLDNEAQLAQLAQSLLLKFQNGQIWLDGENVTDAIRTEACGEAASKIAAYPALRKALVDLQRSFRQAPGLVADGRDMGSVIFPDAIVKVFLTASLEKRAERRYKQLMEKGVYVSLDSILHGIKQRDARDSERSVAPLKQSADASLLDTTSLTIDEAIDSVLALYRTVIKQSGS